MPPNRKRSRQTTIPMMFGTPVRNTYQRYTTPYSRGTFYTDPYAAQRAAYGPAPARYIHVKGVNLKRKLTRGLGDTETRKVSVGRKGKKLFSMSECLKHLYNSVCPKVQFEHRLSTHNLETVSNEQRITEYVLNGFAEVQIGFEKIRQQPPATVAGFSHTALTSTELRYVYEGGTYEYTIKNTCSHTVFLELRVYKTNLTQTGTYGLTMSDSPLKLWQLDEDNNVNGDNWTSQSAVVAPTNSSNTRISTLPIQSTDAPVRANNHIAHVSWHDVNKAPGKHATLLHRVYDMESIKKVALKPGETLLYNVNMPRFYQPTRNDPRSTDTSPIQRYTRVLWLTHYGEMVTDTGTDVARMAPGSTQLTVSVKTIHVYRGLISTKTGFKIQSSDALGDRGGMDNIDQANEATINEETNVEQVYSEIGVNAAN